jgi:hypothetical protein
LGFEKQNSYTCNDYGTSRGQKKWFFGGFGSPVVKHGSGLTLTPKAPPSSKAPPGIPKKST